MSDGYRDLMREYAAETAPTDLDGAVAVAQQEDAPVQEDSP